MISVARRYRACLAAVLCAVWGLLGAGTAAATPSPAQALTVDRGIVVSVSQFAVVLTELDGSVVRLAVGPRTRVFVDGRRASLPVVGRGFVALVYHLPERPARLIRAFDTAGHGRRPPAPTPGLGRAP